MTRITNVPQHPANRHHIASVVTLVRWRPHWLLLVLIGLGMITSVLIICAVPLLSETMEPAGLCSTLGASPENSEVTLNANTGGLLYKACGKFTRKLISPSIST